MIKVTAKMKKETQNIALLQVQETKTLAGPRNIMSQIFQIQYSIQFNSNQSNSIQHNIYLCVGSKSIG